MPIIAHEGAMHQGSTVPSVVFVDAIDVDARRHLRTVDAITASLVAQSVPATFINAICIAALAVENDLHAGAESAPDHLRALNTAIHVAGEWLFAACDSSYAPTEIECTRAILKDILRATRTPALEMHIVGAIQMANGFLIRQHGTSAEIAAWKRSVAEVLASVSASTFIVHQGVS